MVDRTQAVLDFIKDSRNQRTAGLFGVSAVASGAVVLVTGVPPPLELFDLMLLAGSGVASADLLARSLPPRRATLRREYGALRSVLLRRQDQPLLDRLDDAYELWRVDRNGRRFQRFMEAIRTKHLDR